MTTRVRHLLAGVGPVAAAFAPLPAAAHHVMDRELPSTLLEGLLSGLGHPVIGPDHLAFVIALGIAAAVVPGPLAVIAAFVALSAAGVLLHIAELDVPMIEPLVALTVLMAGAALVWSRSVTRPIWIGLAAVAGLLHGYAFGEFDRRRGTHRARRLRHRHRSRHRPDRHRGHAGRAQGAGA